MPSVAPHAGARIETGRGYAQAKSYRSLPTRERELKRRQQPQRAERLMSLPTRERELKPKNYRAAESD